MNTVLPSLSQTEVTVSPSRLASGQWCHRRERQHGEGDIRASYSADLIGMEGRVRSPFRLQGGLWAGTGIGKGAFTAYRLLPLEAFEGEATTYAEKVHADGGEAARNDPSGFYHGMQIRWSKASFVLSGPPVEISAGQAEPEQANLFG